MLKTYRLWLIHVCFLEQDVQVPVCPLCNTPIPIRRGEMPDIKVGEHIDRDCKSDPAQRKRKVVETQEERKICLCKMCTDPIVPHPTDLYK